MTAPHLHRHPRPDFNDLRRGSTYRATTWDDAATGEYLGMETTRGERSLLLRSETGFRSIALSLVTAIRPAA